MPTIAIVGGIWIAMYFNDHDPPHFHARAAEFRARMSILDGQIIDYYGRMNAASRLTLRNWTLMHREALLENWSRAREGRELLRLDRR